MTADDQDLIDMIAKATPEPKVNEDHREALREKVLDAYDQRDAGNEPTRNPIFKITGTTVMKFAAAISFLAIVSIFAVMALAPSKAIAFEDVAREIIKIKTASYDRAGVFYDTDGRVKKDETYKVTVQLPNMMRSELPGKLTTIIDSANDKILILHLDSKMAIKLDGIIKQGGKTSHANILKDVQSHLRRAEQSNNFENIKYETIEAKFFEGKKVVGFRVHNPENVEDPESVEGLFFRTLDIWADADTGRPIHIETTKVFKDNTRQVHTLKNFDYDKALDPQLFSFDIPEGFMLMNDE